MGFDMSTVLPLSPEEQENLEKAKHAHRMAIQERDRLPKEEAGTFDQERFRKAPWTDLDDPALYTGRSARYQAAVDKENRAYQALLDADKSYFWLNIWSMGTYLNVMDSLGMIQRTSGEPCPDWPEYTREIEENDILAWELADAVRGEIADQGAYTTTPAEMPFPEDAKNIPQAVRDYVAQRIHVTLWTPKPVTGIFSGKFNTNDSWWVTPAEIRAALHAYQRQSRTKVLNTLKMQQIEDPSTWDRWIGFLEYAENKGGFLVA